MFSSHGGGYRVYPSVAIDVACLASPPMGSLFYWLDEIRLQQHKSLGDDDVGPWRGLRQAP